MIIGISGKKQSGKDTVGQIIQLLSQGYNRDEVLQMLQYKGRANTSMWQIKKFAGKVKEILSLLTGIPMEELEDETVKESFLNAEWNDTEGNNIMTNRMALQWIGTDLFRDNFHPLTWVNALMKDYVGKDYPKRGIFFDSDTTHFETLFPNWIITDLRFRNEAAAIKGRGGITLRIERPNTKKEVNSGNLNGKLEHQSEVELDSYTSFDYFIVNSGNMKELIRKVEMFILKAKRDDKLR